MRGGKWSRNLTMVQERCNGMSVKDIALKHSLTPDRTRCIINSAVRKMYDWARHREEIIKVTKLADEMTALLKHL